MYDVRKKCDQILSGKIGILLFLSPISLLCDVL